MRYCVVTSNYGTMVAGDWATACYSFGKFIAGWMTPEANHVDYGTVVILDDDYNLMAAGTHL